MSIFYQALVFKSHSFNREYSFSATNRPVTNLSNDLPMIVNYDARRHTLFNFPVRTSNLALCYKIFFCLYDVNLYLGGRWSTFMTCEEWTTCLLPSITFALLERLLLSFIAIAAKLTGPLVWTELIQFHWNIKVPLYFMSAMFTKVAEYMIQAGQLLL